MLVDAYVRVSTQEQAKEGYSIGAQTERLKAYCTARGWTLHRIYTDPAFSGAKLERPGLQQLINDVELHRVDLVLVYKLDRLSRSQKHTLYLIEDVFMKNGVSFVSINENFDTSTAFGRAMVGILSVFAQLEREQIKERSQMGRVERAKDGLWKGGGCVPLGYNYIEQTDELVVDEFEAMQVRDVFRMFLDDHFALNRISVTMTERGYTNRRWDANSTIKRILANSIYIGNIVWQNENYVGKHTPIIEKETFEAAQLRLSQLQTKSLSPFLSTQLLTGIIYCGNCGARYCGSGGYRGSKKLPYSQRNYIHIYTCYSRSKTKRDMIKDPTCKNKRWRAELLDQKVIDTIFKLTVEPDYFDQLVSEHSKSNDTDQQREVLIKRISELDTQISKLLDLYQYDKISTQQISERLESLSTERSSTEKSISELATEQPEITIEQARAVAENAQQVFLDGSIEERRNLVQTLIKRIEILENDIFISWRFI